MRQTIELTNGRPVLNAADLRLCETKPVTNDCLWYAVLAISRHVVRVLSIRPRHPPDVLRRKSVTKLFGFPEIGWYVRCLDAQCDKSLLARTTQAAGVVATEACTTMAVVRHAASDHLADLTGFPRGKCSSQAVYRPGPLRGYAHIRLMYSP